MYYKKLVALITHPLRRAGLLVVVAFLIAGCSTLQKQVRPGWSNKEIAPGVRLSHQYFHSLFNAPENINILDVNLQDTAIAIKIAYNDSLLEPVSEFGKACHAIAAVNGNFFNTHIGGSVCFLKWMARLSTAPTMSLMVRCFFPGSIPLPWPLVETR